MSGLMIKNSHKLYHHPLKNSPKYASIVVDTQSGKILHQENASKIRHPASMTKMMTLYIVFKAVHDKKLSLHTPIKISHNAAQQIPSKIGLKVGKSILVKDAIFALITKSANDISTALAENMCGSDKEFSRLMNKTAKKLGMSHTHFTNSSGVPDSKQITTARDMAILARALCVHFPKEYDWFQMKNFHYLGNNHKNHNRLLGQVRGLDGIKTGFVNASGFNLAASAKRIDKNGRQKRLIVVVMGGKTPKQRDQRVEELLEMYFPMVGVPMEPHLNMSREIKPNIVYTHYKKTKSKRIAQWLSHSKVKKSKFHSSHPLHKVVNKKSIVKKVGSKKIIKKL
jgi:D-alanyl-D-alanine carboxypeptidase